MKKFWLSIIILFLAITPVFAEGAPAIKLNPLRQKQIMRYVMNTPLTVSKNARSLAVYLTKPFDSKIEKMQAIAYWIATHIAYDSYKYDTKINVRNMKYHYDVFKARAGICSDFAKLFQEMSTYAGVRGVGYVSGYVVETKVLKKEYSAKQLGDGHAWNAVNINGYTYYIDTTFMAMQHLDVKNKNINNQWSHKQEIIKRTRSPNKVKSTSNVDFYYFLFTPQDEVHRFGKHHFAVHDY